MESMENSSFEEEFTKNLRSAEEVKPKGFKKSNILIGFLCLLAVIQLIVIIVLILGRQRGGNDDAVNGETVSNDEPEKTYGDFDYRYGGNGELTAMNITCMTKEQAKIQLNEDNSFGIYDRNGNLFEQGEYSIMQGRIINLLNRGAEKYLYFDGIVIVDGRDIYNCLYD